MCARMGIAFAPTDPEARGSHLASICQSHFASLARALMLHEEVHAVDMSPFRDSGLSGLYVLVVHGESLTYTLLQTYGAVAQTTW